MLLLDVVVVGGVMGFGLMCGVLGRIVDGLVGFEIAVLL